MNILRKISFASLLVCILLSACGLSPAEQAATATQAAADSFATQTAQAPTATPTYTPSPTITPTPTATATSTSTPLPTNTPTITPTPTPGWMDAGLVKEDLPEGFRTMSEEELSYLRQSLPPDSLVFGFSNEAKSQAVMGYFISLPTRADQIALDEDLQTPLDIVALILGATEQPEPIPVQDDIGDARLASTFVSDANNFKLGWDIILFRRGEVAVYLFVMYPEVDNPVLQINDLASMLDERIQKSLETIPGSSNP